MAEFELFGAMAAGERTLVGAGVVHHRRSGGFLDRFIQTFHDALGIGQNGRDLVPTGRMRIETRNTADFGIHLGYS